MQKKGIELDNSPKEFKIEKLNLLKGVFNILKGAIGKDYTSIPSDMIDTIGAIKLEETQGQIGWKLISRALVHTLLQLVTEKINFLDIEDIQTADLDKQLNSLLENDKYELDSSFFKTPGKLPFLEDSKEIITNFLKLFELEEYEVKNLMNRFDGYFTLALIDEYRTNINFYKSLKDTVITPFNEAEENVLEWYRYREWLIKQIDEPIFGESFGLSQIYIQINAYYKIKEKEDEKEKNIIVNLEDELFSWIDKKDKKDAIRIIRGGPGYGKSSFFKMFSAKLAKENYNVLFIPLHRIDIKDNMVEAIKNYLKNSGLLEVDPFESENLIIIFDGLDELIMQGKTINESAKNFIREVQHQLLIFNTAKLKLQVLVSGRDIVIQENETNFRQEKQICRLLPYYLNKEEQKKLEPFIDLQKLLAVDKRNDWWKRYGELKLGKYKKLPKELNKHELEEITSQPLLNYLIALSFERDEVDFKQETNLNVIYEDLLIGVYKRAYSEIHKSLSLSAIEIGDFKRILEEIGLSTWHGDGRKTTVAQIESHFHDGGLQKLLYDFTNDAQKGVVSLLTSFYFKKSSGASSGNETFEFTHKSFGEYLTSKRIAASLDKIHTNYTKNLIDRYSDEGWNVKESLTRWLKIFSKKEIDKDLHKFIDNEMQLIVKKDEKKINLYQKTISDFINYTLKHGLPVEKLDPRPSTFYEENKLSLNAEKALLIMHGTIAKYTKEISKIEIGFFGGWLSRMMSQRGVSSSFIMNFLNNLNLTSFNLIAKDFINANLTHSILVEANLKEANLRETNLREADLSRADLSEVNLSGANLSRANLSEVNLSRANLSRANLSEVNLSRADLNGANLNGADLSKAKLNGVDLSGVDLNGANLSQANLSVANLNGVDLSRTNLSGACLSKADLSKANLSSAELSGVNLSIADLSEVTLIGANLSRADLSKAYLSKAYLNGVDLSGANLSGADLSRATLSEVNLIGAYLNGIDLSGANIKLDNINVKYLKEQGIKFSEHKK